MTVTPLIMSVEVSLDFGGAQSTIEKEMDSEREREMMIIMMIIKYWNTGEEDLNECRSRCESID